MNQNICIDFGEENTGVYIPDVKIEKNPFPSVILYNLNKPIYFGLKAIEHHDTSNNNHTLFRNFKTGFSEGKKFHLNNGAEIKAEKIISDFIGMIVGDRKLPILMSDDRVSIKKCDFGQLGKFIKFVDESDALLRYFIDMNNIQVDEYVFLSCGLSHNTVMLVKNEKIIKVIEGNVTSQCITNAIINIARDKLTSRVFEKLKADRIVYNKLLMSVEEIKQTFGYGDDNVKISFEYSLMKRVPELFRCDGEINITHNELQSCFTPTMDEIINLITSIKSKSMLVGFGGFCEAAYVQHVIKCNLDKKFEKIIFIPSPEGRLATVLGMKLMK